MGSTDLHYLTIAEATELIRNHQLSPVELTRAHLERIESLDPHLHAYITVTADRALKEARMAEGAILSGDHRGPLHGIPLGIKDLYDTKGVRTTAHSMVLWERVPEEDATAVARLTQAGTVLLGKLAMFEFAAGGPSPKTPVPPARNPWHLDYTTAGSSSGSAAAVAAGLSMGTLGSDTGGSIRNPSARCGIVGIKPTYGRVSRFGALRTSWSLDHFGPMARTVQDTTLLLQAISGYDPKDPGSSRVTVPDYSLALNKDIKGMVLGVHRNHYFDHGTVHHEVLAAVEKAIGALEELGARTRLVDIPSLEYVAAAGNCIQKAEAYVYHMDMLRNHPEDYGPNVLTSVRSGALYSAVDYIQAQRVKSLVKEEYDRVLTEVDALVTPTMAQPPERYEEYDAHRAGEAPYFPRLCSFLGVPAISVPCGLTSEGLPIGLQIAGRSFDEPTILRIAHAYERSTPWHQKHPPVEKLVGIASG